MYGRIIEPDENRQATNDVPDYRRRDTRYFRCKPDEIMRNKVVDHSLGLRLISVSDAHHSSFITIEGVAWKVLALVDKMQTFTWWE